MKENEFLEKLQKQRDLLANYPKVVKEYKLLKEELTTLKQEIDILQIKRSEIDLENATKRRIKLENEYKTYMDEMSKE